jgi:Zn-dependent M28 family amino/carboxypeptidase
MKRGAAWALAVALFAGACTSAPPRAGESSPRPPVTPLPSPTPPPVVVRFEAARVLVHDREFSVRIGPREAASEAYARAAAYAGARFTEFGYRVVRQRVAVPAGKSEGAPVAAGTSVNVIAYPKQFDPAEPHLVVGGHLDTVVRSPGANDNGSGASQVIELARLSSLQRPRLPVVFVVFTGEERRLPGPSGALFGSRRYLASLTDAERDSLKAMLNIDMVGNGPVVLVCRSLARSARRFLDAVLRQAHRLRIPARENVVTRFFSDHVPFESAGIPVAWLWTGEHPAVHTPRDTMSVVRAEDVTRVGNVAWQTLRAYAG